MGNRQNLPHSQLTETKLKNKTTHLQKKSSATFTEKTLRGRTTEPFPYSKEILQEIPKVSPGEICITTGDKQDPDALALLQTLAEVIRIEKPHLLLYQAAREKYQKASSAWHVAHPPIPRDQTFILRPHRGSRYLSNPTTEKGTSK
jgi:hypothetical protein